MSFFSEFDLNSASDKNYDHHLQNIDNIDNTNKDKNEESKTGNFSSKRASFSTSQQKKYVESQTSSSHKKNGSITLTQPQTKYVTGDDEKEDSSSDDEKVYISDNTKYVPIDKKAQFKGQLIQDDEESLPDSFVISPNTIKNITNKADDKLFDKVSKSLSKLHKLIAASDQEIPKAKGKDLTICIGNTGAGKSTFVNVMCGSKMSYHYDEQKQIDILTSEPEIMKPGHSSLAETYYTKIHKDINSGITFGDCPGFLDQRNSKTDALIYDLSNCSGLHKTVSVAKSVKIILLVNYADFLSARGKAVKDTIETLKLIFGSNYLKYKDNIITVITKVDTIDAFHGRNKRNALSRLVRPTKNKIRQFLNQNGGGFLCNLLHLYDPMGDDIALRYDKGQVQGGGATSRADFIQLIKGIKGIAKPETVFQYTLSNDSKLFLNDLCQEIKNTVPKLVKSGNFQKVFDRLQALNDLAGTGHPDVITVFSELKMFIQNYAEKLSLDCINQYEKFPKKTTERMKLLKQLTHFSEFETVDKAWFKTLKEKYINANKAIKKIECMNNIESDLAKGNLNKVAQWLEQLKNIDSSSYNKLLELGGNLHTSIKQYYEQAKSYCDSYNWSKYEINYAKVKLAEKSIPGAPFFKKSLIKELSSYYDGKKHEQIQKENERRAQARRIKELEQKVEKGKKNKQVISKIEYSLNHEVNGSMQRRIKRALDHALSAARNDSDYTAAKIEWPWDSWGKKFGKAIKVELYDSSQNKWVGFDQNGRSYSYYG